MPRRSTFRKQQARSLAAQREKVREEEAPHGVSILHNSANLQMFVRTINHQKEAAALMGVTAMRGDSQHAV